MQVFATQKKEGPGHDGQSPSQVSTFAKTVKEGEKKSVTNETNQRHKL